MMLSPAMADEFAKADLGDRWSTPGTRAVTNLVRGLNVRVVPSPSRARVVRR